MPEKHLSQAHAWNLGKWTYVSGWYAVLFVLLMIPILNLPQYRGKNLTPELMNWTCLVYYGAMSLAIAWYFIYAHKIFKGPKSNITNTVIPNYEEKDEAVDEVVVGTDDSKDIHRADTETSSGLNGSLSDNLSKRHTLKEV